MSDLERRIAAALGRRSQLEPPQGFEASVKRGIRRRKRVFVTVGVISVAVMAGSGAIAVNVLRGSSPSDGGVQSLGSSGAVPWVNRGASKSLQPSAVTVPAVLNYPACKAGALSATAGAVEMGAGQYGRDIAVTNTGTTPCNLDSSPSTVYGLSPSGSSQQVTYSDASGDDSTVSMVPGQSVKLALTTTSACSKPSLLFSRFRLTMDGGGLSVSLPSGLDVSCGLRVTALTSQSPAAPSPLSALTVTTTMPDHVTHGATVQFAVTLTNPTSSSISLDPCPNYTEFIAPMGTNPTTFSVAYQLNCSGAGGQIGAGGSVAFDMQVAAPTSVGQAKWGWQLSGAVQSGGVLSVV